eukprot:205812_1
MICCQRKVDVQYLFPLILIILSGVTIVVILIIATLPSLYQIVPSIEVHDTIPMYIDSKVYNDVDNDMRLIMSGSNHMRMQFSIIDLPYELDQKWLDYYRTEFGPDRALPNDAFEQKVAHMFKQNKFYSPNTGDDINIYVIIPPLHAIHIGDWMTKGENYQQIVWPKHGWGQNTRLKLFENITLYLNHSLYTNEQPHINHCLTEICHFYVVSGCEDIPHIFKAETNVLRDNIFNFNVISVVHPYTTIAYYRSIEKHESNPLYPWPLTPSHFERFDTIIIPYYHDIKKLNEHHIGYKNNPDTHVPTLSERKYLFASSFSFQSVRNSNIHRGAIAQYTKDCMNKNGTVLDGHKVHFNCIDYTFRRGNVGMTNIFDIWKNSVFCATTDGDSFPCIRTYSILLSGCIPVTINDDHNWFAFENTLNWNTFSVMIDENVLDYAYDGNVSVSWINYVYNMFRNDEDYGFNIIKLSRMHQSLLNVRTAMIFSDDFNAYGEINAIDLTVRSMQKSAYSMIRYNRWLKLNSPNPRTVILRQNKKNKWVN